MEQHRENETKHNSMHRKIELYLSCLWLFVAITLLLSPQLYGQSDYFRVEADIPHLPVYQSTSDIISPGTGMLVYSRTDQKPMVYTGNFWVDFCSTLYEDDSAQDYFTVINGIPYLPEKVILPSSPSSGAFLYSRNDQSIVVSGGSGWVKMASMGETTLLPNDHFSTDNVIQTCFFPVLSADPSSAAEGDMYISIPEKSFRYCNGSEWLNIACQASVTTIPVTDLIGGTGTGGGMVTSTGGSAITIVGICWGFAANPDTTLNTRTRQKITSGDGLGPFTSSLSGLLPNMTYHVRAYAVNAEGVFYGEDLIFITTTTIPTIITLEASNLTSMTAESGGDITADGGAPITARGIIWSMNGDPLSDSDALISNDGSGVGTFPSTLTGLLGNTTYYVRAYAVNSKGTAYGNLVQFTTPPPIPPELNALVTISDITGESALVDANIINNGGAPITERGVAWSADGIIFQHFPSSDDTGSETGNFQTLLDGLSPGTTYYIKAYATNIAGTGYSSTTSFVTAAPAVITTVPPSNIAGFSALSGGIITSVGNSDMTARGICWSTEKDPTTDLATKTSESITGDGSGTFASSMSNLLPGTKYYVRAYAVNAAGTAYGNLDSLMTLDYPLVTTLAPASFMSSTAIGGGAVLSDGGSVITVRGVCWSTSPNPTISSYHTSDGTGLGSFSSTLTGLAENVTYYVRAYARNSVGVAYGESKTFIIIPEAPEIITLEASSVTSMQAESGGDITSDGGSPITGRGIIWSVNGDPLEDPSHIMTDDGSGVGLFPSTLVNLLGNTTYYVRAYAVNNAGTSYGNLIQLTTPDPILPELSSATIMIYNITDVSAVGKMEVLNNGGAPVTARGICISTDRVTYQYYPSETLNPTDIGVFISQLTGLAPGTLYYAKGYAVNSAGTAYSSETSFVTASPVQIVTIAPTNVTGISALSGGIISSAGNSDITARGICWGTEKDPTTDLPTKTNVAFAGDGTGTYSSSITDLTPGTKYYVRAYAINAAGTAYGNLDSLTTLKYPTVITLSTASFMSTSAVGGGNVVDDGGADVTARGVCWSTAENPTISSAHTSDGNGTGIFSSILTGLAPNVVYHVRAYARNSVGVAYGEDKTFIIIPEAPEIITLDPTNVTSISAESGGDISNDGGSPITGRGIVWSIVGDPLDDPDAKVSDDGSGVGVFPSTLTGLLGNTTFYVRAYAINKAGTSYGNLVVFTTLPPVAPELSSASILISEITDISAVGEMEILNNGGAPVTARGISLSTDRIHYHYYPSETTNLTDIGVFVSNLTGLVPGTTYYAKGYATNTAGTGYTSETSFVTASVASIFTIEPTGITQNTAQSGGIISNLGNSDLIARGICWNTVQNPTVDLSTKTSESYTGTGLGTYTSAITGLIPYTTYHVRAYAQNSAGIAYGDEYSFTTLDATVPEVVTIDVINIGGVYAEARGRVNSTGGLDVTERGFCWSVDADPTIADDTLRVGSGPGSFSAQLENLASGTTYYARAYGINEKGISYGDSYQFTTKLPATLITTKPSNITSSTALSGGTITGDGGDSVTSRGVCWGTFRNPTLDDHFTIDGSDVGIFTSNISGLNGSTKYFVRAYAVNSAGIAYGNLDSLYTSTSTVPWVVTNGVTAGGTTAVVQGTVSDNGGETVVERGFCWSTEKFTTIDDNYIVSGSGDGSFSGNLMGLIKGQTYYVRAYARNHIGISYGDELSFVTATLANITTNPVSEITGTSAVSGGIISSDGGSPVTESGICWNTTGSPTVTNPHTTEGIGIGEFIHTMTGLMATTTYYVRAYAINGAGIVYGNQQSFISGLPEFAVVKTVTPKSEPNGISGTSGGTVLSNGGTIISSGGICWSTQSGFIPDTVRVNRTTHNVSGNFTSTLTGLLPGTTYYVRAYVVNAIGTSYADNELSFTTNSVPVVVTLEPDYSTVTSTSVVAGGSIISDGGSAVIRSGVCWSTSQNPVIGESNYTSNGPGLGDFTSTITGLMGSRTYYIRAYATNAVGTVYGNEVSFTTDPPTLASIITNPVTLLSSTSASGGGTITSNGGALVTTRGLVWCTEPNFEADTIVRNRTASTGYYTGSFTDLIANLAPNTIYYLKAYVENEVGIAYGNEVSFFTPVVPVLTTAYASATGPTTATSGGNISSDGGSRVISRGVVWSKVATFDPDTVIVNRTSNGSGTGSFASYLKGLKGNTTYYIQAYAKNIAGTAYGNMLSFITDPPTLPTLTTRAAWYINGTTVSTGGHISDDGGEPVTTRGMVWSTVSGFRPDTVQVNRTAQTGSGIGYFTTGLSGLQRGTTYYMRAYAVNAVGTAYGNELSFTTLDFVSLTTLEPAASSTGTSAVGGGTIQSNGGARITNVGVCWSTGHNPTVSLHTKTTYDRLSGDTFRSTLTGLLPVTTYYVRAYAVNNQGVAYGNEVSFTTPAILPTITTNYVVPITKSSVVTGGNITDDGGAEVTARGVVWSTNSNFDPDTVVVNKSVDGFGTGNFSSTITGLNMSISYYIRAYATNSVGTVFGNQVSVTIFPTAPRLITLEVTDVGGYTAGSGGEITSDGGAAVTLKGVCWSTHTNPTIDDSRTYNGSGTDTYTSNITGLTPNTLYYVRAYAINKIGVAYGLERTFLTDAFPTLVATDPVTDIIATTATSGGEITDDGRTPILARGICWSIRNAPTIALSTKTVDKTTTGIGKFVAHMSGLKPETDYYVRAYATNAVGTSYGSQVSFRTLEVMLPTVTTTAPSAIDSTHAVSGGEVLNDGGMPVNVRGVCWGLSDTLDLESGSKLNDISGGLGTFVSSISGLLPGTKYYVKAFATNSLGTAYGKLDSMTTQAIRPAVSKVIMSGLTMTTGDGSASVITDGGSPVTDRGLYWNRSGDAPPIPMPADSSISLGAGGPEIEGTINGLEDNTTYYVWAYATNQVGTRFSPEPVTFTTPTIPTVITRVPKSVARNTAVCGGTVTSDGGVPVTSRGVCYSTSGIPTIDTLFVKHTYGGTGAYSLTVTELEEGTKYYVRAFATNNMGTGYGELDSLTTLTIPTVVTAEADTVWSNGAITGGEVVADGGAIVILRGVCWSSDTIPTVTLLTKTKNGSGLGEFPSTIGGLTHATPYYIRAYATNSLGTAYGEIDTIVTAPVVPTVGAVKLDAVDDSTQVGTSEILDNGGAEVTVRGLCWNTEGSPTLEDSVIVNAEAGLGVFGDTITGLVEGPTYYIRAFATNSAGTAYGPDVSSKSCPTAFTVTHMEGLAGAPETKTVVYHSVSTELSGALRCWLTQNLGADQQATSMNDATEESAGWYWQFNRAQGYKYDSSRMPSNAWTGSISQSAQWGATNDPCNLLLGLGWRIPTSTEWSRADGDPQNWTSGTDAYNSVLKLHSAGVLAYNTGVMAGRGSYGRYWSGTQYNSSNGYYLNLLNGSVVTYMSKAYALPLRCIRDGITLSVPSVSNVVIPDSTMTETSAVGIANVVLDGGAAVTSRGLCWSTTGTPTIANNLIPSGSGKGEFRETLSNLEEGPTYYVRAYATNSEGTAYSPAVTSIKICPANFEVIHTEGLNGAPVSKTITYHSISTNISGKAACWLTQNLGADQEAGASTDASEASSGWYWQFNRSQGYQYNGSRVPSNAWTSWTGRISENANWAAANDPCSLLLGLGWRIPTSTEWTKADAPPQNWTTAANAYSSVLKLHMGGYLNYSNGAIAGRGTIGYYWSSNQSGTTAGYSLILQAANSAMTSMSKAYALPVRCIRDAFVKSSPIVSNVTVADSTMTETTADGTATVASDGGATVTERGLCWNNTGTPTIADQVIESGGGTGTFTITLDDLDETVTYYVRAYATNAEGTAYSPSVTSFKICPAKFDVIHTEGLNGAPISKTVTYHSISTNISGKAACWLTQNLGSDRQPNSMSDASEAAAGWYWQFNRSQGYEHDGKTLVPSNAWTSWTSSISENLNWDSANDPCNLLLGLGWRIPTYNEWYAADAAPQYWTSGTNAYNSILKLHSAGMLNNTNGAVTGRGSYGRYWSTVRYNSNNAYFLDLYNGSAMSYFSKAYALPLRCIRDALTISVPVVSDVIVPDTTMTKNSAVGTATVASDGGAVVTARGLVWNTSGTPTLADSVIVNGTGTGIFVTTIPELNEEATYYVRAYATNSKGTAYSPSVTSFKICPVEFKMIHTEGLNGAPVSKTVTYHSISTNISGKAACWLTQNLGADQEAGASTDASEASSGWYWQFNRSQGYQYNGSRVPSNAWTSWTGRISESANWAAANDPCSLLLGLGWRIPTSTEWTKADAPPQNWTTAANAYSSILKLHMGGYLNYSNGAIAGRGTIGYYWSSNQSGTTAGYSLILQAANSAMTSMSKAYALPVRCIRDAVTVTIPSVSDVNIPTTGMTETTASGTATVASDGGDAVTDRGLCWSTSVLIPTISDNKIQTGEGTGTFTGTLAGLNESATYYVRAYATNSKGTAYSPAVTSFKICPVEFDVIHTKDLNGAPVTKTVTYHSISTNISGKAACWLTQNLGADYQPTSIDDASEASSGWYWQFNRSQGYEHDGKTLVPSNAWTSWTSSISENLNWDSANDPCNLLLGLGWRIPTYNEWYAADAAPQYWTSGTDAYNSVLKLHSAGMLNNTNGAVTGRGSYGRYWSTVRYNSNNAYFLDLYNGSAISYFSKAYALPLRCIREAVAISKPSISDVIVLTSDMTDTTAIGTATVASDGGAAVTARGLCWNITGNPTTADQLVPVSGDLGLFSGKMAGLDETSTYYVRAYATNSEGTAYSPSVTSFKICPVEFKMIHTEGLNGAPVSKTVTYHSISTNISGKAACWLTQNLGADQEAGASTDASEASSGWYWQFNRSQGYQYNGSRVPSNAWTSWTGSISESANWAAANDPCSLLLGLGWRIPTSTEWTKADAPPQNWTTAANAYSSVLKLHMGGYLNYSNGAIAGRGTIGYYWSSNQSGTTAGYSLILQAANSAMTSMSKAYALPVRCIRDAVTVTIPSVSDVNIPTTGMTETTASGTATVASDGGDAVTDRGLCWSIISTKPTIFDNTIPLGSGTGIFTGTMEDLTEASTYYVRAYATNSKGTAYSPAVTSFKICPTEFSVIHTEGLNGAPVSKIVSYHSISSNISGKAACWLTQNLGSDRQPTSVDDASEASSGWYWQFNRSQGYKYEGSTLTPSNAWTSWTSSISENLNWDSANDPCNLLLGLGWRIPTYNEWYAADAAPQYWISGTDAYNSVLKLHSAGMLNNTNGVVTGRGSYGRYWSTVRYNSNNAYFLDLYNGSAMSYFSKAYALPLRCIREAVTISKPSVSNVSIPTTTMTKTTAAGSVTVSSDGGAAVTDRGLCWNTTGNPTTADTKIAAGTGTGSFTSTLSGLTEEPTYYVRAYATNSEGTAYSPEVTSFKICPVEFKMIHTEGLNGAPVSKTVTYHSISTNISGKAACWLTQNLGADQEAGASTDASEASSGWYWQFNRSQGYQYNGSRVPSNAWTSWTGRISESANWAAANDPCSLLLGLGWRIPTSTEWTKADAPPQNWTTAANAYSSILKLHMGGYLNYSNGAIAGRGTIGYYWSSNQSGTTAGYSLILQAANSAMTSMSKAYALPVRCIRDAVTVTIPSVSDVNIPTTGMTETTASGTATVASDGGDAVTDRGLCWSTSVLIPTISDNKIQTGEGTGTFTGTLAGLNESATYYVRAYATNSKGTAYSPAVTSFKICPVEFDVIHTKDLNGAPVTKTVTYHSISTNISGKAACWLTQNLGADYQPTSIDDASEASSGWYWQFNRSQGYEHDGKTLVPSNAWTSWTSSISENLNWDSANDPCNLLLGLGWRIPTYNEWYAADAAPQYWTSGTDAYNSVLKLHSAGMLNNTNGAVTGRGSYGRYWSTVRYNSNNAYFLDLYNGSAMSYFSKAYALPVRCIRDGVTITKPVVSVVTVPTSAMTMTTAAGTATVVSDGGDALTDRGLCWNTTGNPTTADNKIPSGSTIGTFTSSITGLTDGPTYYVRAYATNGQGTAYSSFVTSFKICPTSFSVIHAEGLNGAPVSKTVTYHSISSNISGKAACWLTQNLGADRQPNSLDDASEAASGWYWQFNRSQGYQYDGGRVPSNAWTSWTSRISESANWASTNDPCRLLLGLGWRIPTSTEWVKADAPPQYWTSPIDAWDSVLKLHSAGMLVYNTGALAGRGGYGRYFSSNQSSTTTAYFLELNGGSSVSTITKAYALPIRCIRDGLSLSKPSVSNVFVPTGSMTANAAVGSATVTISGGTDVTERGLCWNTYGNPTTADSKVASGAGTGSFSGTLSGLSEGPTYYVRAYAINAQGITYSPAVSSFKICPTTFAVTHTNGVSGAPVNKNVTYHSISSNISGKAACWLTQNLGADRQATSINDATEVSAGWYWQFNRSQAYQYGSSRVPATSWVTSISESAQWALSNDPCRLLLGSTWRIPSRAEWLAADAQPQYWTSGTDAWNSVLKLHAAGMLVYNTGVIAGRGSYGRYWSSNQYTSSTGYFLELYNGSSVSTITKAYALPARCIRD